ncbi:MFS transporter permease [Desulfonema magnum]|uniref:MFS transporter permease n=1 Tax=Desulfonema magnum TaxID=45655 RepID=A0A975BP21_9BACT|nr:MFS transporter permease [Desulfonema magnum]QTA89016.1 Uncharacterized protein dnm_050630 [Desulfonema magnum]
MADKEKPIVIIPREKAVFRLDKNGIWHTDDEKFTNQKIISYFHSIIKKDKDGYFLEQEHEHFLEKVYFPYEDTPLFVFRIIENNGLILCLSTGKKIRLDPEKLLMKNDNLYVRNDEDIIKLNADAMLSLASYMDDADGQYVINTDGKRYVIPCME